MSELIYEKINESHKDDLKKIWCDEDVIKYTNIKEPYTEEEIKENIERLKKYDIFAVKKENQVLGVIGCACINKQKTEHGIFYQFRKDVWNKGLGTESMKWILNYMKEKYISLVIYADVVEDNIASDKILKKCGFKYIGTDVNSFQRENKKMNVKHYKLKL